MTPHHILAAKSAALGLMLAIALAGTGCASTTPQLDARFGQAARLAASQQVLNPSAGGDAPVNGIEGSVARESMIRYRSGFKEPTPQSSVFTIGVSR